MKSEAAQTEQASDGSASARLVGVVPGGAEDGVTLAITDLTQAVARREAVVEAGDAAAVGDLVDAYADGENTVTVRFSATVDGYRGWRWSVTLFVLDPERPTVSEVVLLPGPDALLAPAWVPWEERVRSGDLGVGDLLPPAPDDVRIVPAYVHSDDPAVEELAREIGVGRVRVLSREGRAEAAERWHTGEFGPDDEMARHAPATCATCAFFVPLAGALGAGFGVCANELSPADGRVVDRAYGCGAHSEAIVDRPAASATGDNVLDELRLDVFVRDTADEYDPVRDDVRDEAVTDDEAAADADAVADGDVADDADAEADIVIDAETDTVAVADAEVAADADAGVAADADTEALFDIGAGIDSAAEADDAVSGARGPDSLPS